MPFAIMMRIPSFCPVPSAAACPRHSHSRSRGWKACPARRGAEAPARPFQTCSAFAETSPAIPGTGPPEDDGHLRGEDVSEAQPPHYGDQVAVPCLNSIGADDASLSRRKLALCCAAASSLATLTGGWATPGRAEAGAEQANPGYKEYDRTPGGVLYEDIREGEGAAMAPGDKVVVDWAAYTVHRGFVVQAKLLTKGGAFEGDDASLLRFCIGDGSVIPAIDEALLSMRAGGIRRLIVQPGPMYYPASDKRGDKQSFQEVGPKPTTFSGRRALDQVLTNPGAIDKSIVMDIELLEVTSGGAARRGPGHLVARQGVTTDTQWDSLGGRRQSGGLYQGN